MDFQDLQLFAAECAKIVLKKAPEGLYFIVVLHQNGLPGSAISGNVPPRDIEQFLKVVNTDMQFIGSQGIEEN